jgi:ribonuclease P protein component
MSLKYTDRGNKKGYRAAVVVSRKVHKSAVTRNRIRRRIYEIIRRANSELIERKDLVLTVFSERVADMDNDELRGQVEKLLAAAR